MTDNRLRLKKCIIANFTLLILMIGIISIFKEPDDKYLRIDGIFINDSIYDKIKFKNKISSSSVF